MMKDGCKRVASAVVIQAVRDLEDAKKRKDAQKWAEVFGFFCSQWFSELAEVAEFDWSLIFRQVKNDSYNKDVSLRTPYR